MVYMPKPTAVGESKSCPICATKGITAMIKAVETEYQGTKKLSWKNEDGSSHIRKQGDEFVHSSLSTPSSTKTATVELDGDFRKSVDSVKTLLNEPAKNFCAYYLALREIFEPLMPVTDDRQKQIMVGQMINLYHNEHGPIHPVDFQKSSSMPTEIGKPKSIHKFGLVNGSSHSGLPTVEGRELATGNDLPSLPNPFFLSKERGERQIRFVPKCLAHGVLCDEKTYECKLCVKEAEEKSMRINQAFATGGTIDKGLLL